MKEKQKIIIIITVLFIMATGIFYYVNYDQNRFNSEVITMDTSQEAPSSPSTQVGLDTTELVTSGETGAQEEPEKAEICVHICGQVKKPGVYQVKDTDRVADVIKMAGGFLKQAAQDSVNQAQHLSDGQQIYIPTKDEVALSDKTVSSVSSGSMTGADSSLVNINQAGMEELMTLPGIGESKAQSIIRYREENQGFQSIEEIKNIEGIKDGVFRKIQDFITIS